MFLKKNRLRSEKDIKALFAKGKGVFALDIGLKYLKTEHDEPRITVSVGTKVSKRAVDRNRLKRQVRAMVEPLVKDLSPGVDIVLMTKKSALEKTYEELQKQVIHIFKKANLL